MEGKLSEVMASKKNERDSKKTIFEHAAYVSSLSSSLISLMYVVLVVDSWSRPAAVVFVGQWGLLTQCEPIVLVSVTQRGDNCCSFCPFDDFSYEFLIFLPFTTFLCCCSLLSKSFCFVFFRYSAPAADNSDDAALVNNWR